MGNFRTHDDVSQSDFSRQMLEQKLYNWDTDISSNTIEVHIHNLRYKLGKDFIRTVRGLGYCIDTPKVSG
jgi:two-component system response regulator QseB